MQKFERVFQERFFDVLPEEAELVRLISGGRKIGLSAVASGHVGLVRFYDLPPLENLENLDRFECLSEVNLLGGNEPYMKNSLDEITPLLAEKIFFPGNNIFGFWILNFRLNIQAMRIIRENGKKLKYLRLRNCCLTEEHLDLLDFPSLVSLTIAATKGIGSKRVTSLIHRSRLKSLCLTRNSFSQYERSELENLNFPTEVRFIS